MARLPPLYLSASSIGVSNPAVFRPIEIDRVLFFITWVFKEFRMHFLRPSVLTLVGGLGWIGAMSLASANMAGCSSSTGESNGNSNSSGSESSSSSSGTPATFTEIYDNILQPTCAVSGCHVPGGIGVTTGNLDMSSKSTAYTKLFEVAASGSGCSGKGTRVVPNQPDESVLAWKVDPALMSMLCGSAMPLDGTPLTQTQIDQIESWIMAGAMDN